MTNRRYINTVNDNVIVNHKEISDIKKDVQETKALHVEILAELKKLNMHVKVTTIDLTETFPIRNQEQIVKFMKEDDMLKDRKLEFYAMIYNICTLNGNLTHRQFGDAVVEVIFSRDYLKEYRWPTLV